MSKRNPKRFYETVSTEKVDGGVHVKLDGHTLKTPGKLTFIAPSQKIADLAAKEWEAQGDKIKPETMPVTRLLNVALELTPSNRPKLIAEARSYGSSDVMCYRDVPGALARHQAARWDPVLDWARQRGIDLAVTQTLRAITQPETSLDNIRDYAAELDDLRLTLLLHLTAVYGSAVLAIAVLDGHLGGVEAFDLSRVDADWQIAQCGEDEDAAKNTQFLRAEVDALCQLLED